MKTSSKKAAGLLAIALSFSLPACSGGDAMTSTAPSPDAVMDENDLRSPSFSGAYAASTSDDDQYVYDVKVEQRGSKLVIRFDADGRSHDLDLTKTRSGAYVFSTGDLNGECDAPGCYYLTKISGVVYLKKVGTKRVPTVKLTVRAQYDHPEYDGDLEGEQTTTVRWAKKSR
ncbi:MAG: hypothetical protein JST00_08335 [Deltaproteobacteria bacterium]|nr:hypothetical protein [Deltaproteobacteria bacterium]